MSKNYLILGQWNAICDVCGYKVKSGELRKRWDGLMVCEYDWETRHMQDLIRISAEKVMVPWSRSEAEDVFIDVCYIWDQSGYAGLGTAGCMRAGNDSQTYEFLAQLKSGA